MESKSEDFDDEDDEPHEICYSSGDFDSARAEKNETLDVSKKSTWDSCKKNKRYSYDLNNEECIKKVEKEKVENNDKIKPKFVEMSPQGKFGRVCSFIIFSLMNN